jgi:hypothetical protein
MRRLLLVVLGAAALGGCASETATVPTTIKAPPQTARLDWKEQYPSAQSALVFGVARFTVTPTGWKADISVQNTSSVAWTVGDPSIGPELAFGVVLFPNDDLDELERRNRNRDLPALRAATTYVPALPQRIEPGQTWQGTMSAPGALAGGLWVRLSFGPFGSAGDPPDGAQTPVVWYTDHAYHLEQVVGEPA